MEYQKILNLLNEANDFNFVTRRWNIVNDNSKENYDVANEITYNTEVLKSSLCDYSDAYILVIDIITVKGHQATQVAFKNCAPFTKFITQIDETTIDDAEDLDLIMPMYSFIEYTSNSSETTGTFQFYSKDEAINFNADIAYNNDFKSFKYKAKLLGNTEAQPAPNAATGIQKNAAIAVLLKYLSNYWRSLEIPLINCKVELKP